MNPIHPQRTTTAPETQTSNVPPEAPSPSRKPPRAMSWWLLVAFLTVALVSALIGARYGRDVWQVIQDVTTPAAPSTAQTAAGHDHAGTGEPGMATGAGEEGAAEAQYYTCGMHPWVILPHPGDCPVCHMELTPLDPSKFTGEVSIDPVVVQNIGVRIEPVTEGPLVRTIRTVGTVEYDETRVRDVNTKISGWIEQLYVDFVGASVEEGEPLFTLYSPALVQAQEEFLLALRRQREAPSASQTGLGQPLDLVESAHTKLELFDITPEQIDELARTGEASRTMTVLSPHTGVVIAKHATEGMKIDPGTQVFRIADLSKVWVLATLYESQLPFVSEGQRAAMTLSYIPGQTFEGRVVYIYPYVDPRTHEAQVRLEFDNPDGLLKPGMFATVELQSELKREAVLVPRAAVLSTGRRDIAFVSRGEGRFEPREVRLGAETGEGQIEILEGLMPGEMVVTSGQFLLDSESRIREALAKMVRGDLAADQQARVATAGRSELESLPETVAASLIDVLHAYLPIGERLASDRADGLAEPARELVGALDRVVGATIPEDENFWHTHTEAADARAAALELASTTDLAAARETFAELSLALDKLFRATGVPPGLEEEVQSLHCPMFMEDKGGAIWLQAAGPVRNPFFGAMMLECFDQREALPVTGEAPEEASPAPEAPAPEASPMSAAPDTEVRQALDDVVAAYLVAQDHLTQNQAGEAAASLVRIKDNLDPLLALPGEAGKAALRISSGVSGAQGEPAALRTAFSSISDALLIIAETVPPSIHQGGLYHAYCPMVDEHWLQSGQDVRNPYDPDMLTCGVIKGRVDEGAAR